MVSPGVQFFLLFNIIFYKYEYSFCFPGQGSQSVGMLNSFNDCKIINDVIKDASDFLNKDLLSLINNGPSDELNLTTNTDNYASSFIQFGKNFVSI